MSLLRSCPPLTHPRRHASRDVYDDMRRLPVQQGRAAPRPLGPSASSPPATCLSRPLSPSSSTSEPCPAPRLTQRLPRTSPPALHCTVIPRPVRRRRGQIPVRHGASRRPGNLPESRLGRRAMSQLARPRRRARARAPPRPRQRHGGCVMRAVDVGHDGAFGVRRPDVAGSHVGVRRRVGDIECGFMVWQTQHRVGQHIASTEHRGRRAARSRSEYRAPLHSCSVRVHEAYSTTR